MQDNTYRKLHYSTGIIIAAFVALHLFNHACSVVGAATHIQVMHALRLLYRNPVVEIWLLGAVLVQIITGLRLFRQKRRAVSTIFDKLHIYSGLYLALFLVIHVAAVLAGRLVLKLDTNFYFGVAGLNSFPVNLFFIPYYALAILSFFGHIAAIHYIKMKAVVFGLSPLQQARLLLVLGFLVMVFIFYGLTNGFAGVTIPKEYEVLTGK